MRAEEAARVMQIVHTVLDRNTGNRLTHDLNVGLHKVVQDNVYMMVETNAPTEIDAPDGQSPDETQ